MAFACHEPESFVGTVGAVAEGRVSGERAVDAGVGAHSGSKVGHSTCVRALLPSWLNRPKHLHCEDFWGVGRLTKVTCGSASLRQG